MEQERQRVEEEGRFRQETSHINQLLEQHREVLEKWKLKRREDNQVSSLSSSSRSCLMCYPRLLSSLLQWENYSQCRTLPDPSDERSFNTYLSLSEESQMSKADIHSTLSKIKEYLQARLSSVHAYSVRV